MLGGRDANHAPADPNPRWIQWPLLRPSLFLAGLSIAFFPNPSLACQDDSIPILVPVVEALAKDFPMERVVIRARPAVSSLKEALIEGVGGSRDPCAVRDCVRAGKIFLEFADLAVEDTEAVVHVGRVSLRGPDTIVQELIKVLVTLDVEGEAWEVKEVIILAVGHRPV